MRGREPIVFGAFISDKGGKRRIDFTFNQTESDALHLFLQNVDQLRGTGMIANRRTVQATLTAGGGLQAHASLPPQDELLAFVLLLRPIILKREPASFERMIDILGRRIEDPGFRSHLKGLRSRFEGKAQGFRISSGDVAINSEHELQNWLNSLGGYHQDSDKRERFRELFETFPPAFAEATFVNMLQDKAGAALELAHIIAALRGECELYRTKDFIEVRKRR